jgi:hypothetical protein
MGSCFADVPKQLHDEVSVVQDPKVRCAGVKTLQTSSHFNT